MKTPESVLFVLSTCNVDLTGYRVKPDKRSQLLASGSSPFLLFSGRGRCGCYTVLPRDESVAGACWCRVYNNTATCSCPPRSHTLSTMAPPTTRNTSSIFRNGKLKPGIYQIQHFCHKLYMDIHELSREVCCRPATDLEQGRGLVRPV